MSRDAAPMTRAAAAEALEDRAELVDLCLAIVGREPPTDEELRLAAHGRLATTGSPAAFAALEHDLHTRDLSPGARWTLSMTSLSTLSKPSAGVSSSVLPSPLTRLVITRKRRGISPPCDSWASMGSAASASRGWIHEYC